MELEYEFFYGFGDAVVVVAVGVVRREGLGGGEGVLGDDGSAGEFQHWQVVVAIAAGHDVFRGEAVVLHEKFEAESFRNTDGREVGARARVLLGMELARKRRFERLDGSTLPSRSRTTHWMTFSV